MFNNINRPVEMTYDNGTVVVCEVETVVLIVVGIDELVTFVIVIWLVMSKIIIEIEGR